MAMLKSIHIQGFKSIRDARVELGRVNVLIGANASGKSNLVGFFRMLNELAYQRFQQYVAVAGRVSVLLHHGPKVTAFLMCDLTASTTPEARYSFRVMATDTNQAVFIEDTLSIQRDDGPPTQQGKYTSGVTESQIDAFRFDPACGEMVALLKSLSDYQFHDSSKSSPMRLGGYIGDNQRLNRDGGNLAAVLHKFAKVKPAFYRRIVATIRQVFPQFDDFVLEPEALDPNSIRLNWRERGQDTLFGPHQFSDGTLRFIALVTLLLQPEDELPKVIVIDEPELGLHPYAIGVLASLITAASRYSQVIVATQSVTLLDQFDTEDVIVVERDRVHNATEFRRLNADELAVWKDEYENPISLGELWERNIIGGGPH